MTTRHDDMDGGVTAARIEKETEGGWRHAGRVGTAPYWRARAEKAEVERDAQTAQCHYWKALHEKSEARLQARKAVHADQIKYWQGETRIASDDATRAEERIRAVRDLLDEHVYTHDGEPLRLPIPHDDLREALDGDA